MKLLVPCRFSLIFDSHKIVANVNLLKHRHMNDLILCNGVAAFGVADFINPLPWYIPSKQKTKGSFDIFRVLRKKKLTWNWLEKFCRIARNANFKGVFCWLHFSYFQWTRLSRIFIKVFNCLCHDLIIAKLCACGLDISPLNLLQT